MPFALVWLEGAAETFGGLEAAARKSLETRTRFRKATKYVWCWPGALSGATASLSKDANVFPPSQFPFDLLPDGRGMLKAARPAGTIQGFIGLLAGRTKKVATIEEFNEATAKGWAGKE
jgi:hypothetical protein